MRLRGKYFSPVYNASGARGFFGEGYPFHRWWKLLGLTFRDCGFIAKTITLEPRAGNLPLRADFRPRELRPKCIIVDFRQGTILNAVGLSNPGASALLDLGRWQQRIGESFFLSFMAVGSTSSDRLNEMRQFVSLLQSRLAEFMAAIGLEINFSCPNTSLHLSSLVNEISQSLDIAAALNIPLQVKVSAAMPVAAVCEACRHQACDALTVSNTIPWGQLPERIDWPRLFGTSVSPLCHLGGGGLSGWPLTPIVCDYIQQVRDFGFDQPIWACGGIDNCQAVDRVKDAGASGVQLGTVAIVRPWRMRKIIHHANQVFW